MHDLYTPADFTTEELDRLNSLAIAVVEGGLGVCKRCGKAEAELEEPCGKITPYIVIEKVPLKAFADGLDDYLQKKEDNG